MNDNPVQSDSSRCWPAVARILGEALLVAAVGAVFAFAANRISPEGLALTRNYFPSGSNNEVRPIANAIPPSTTGTNATPLSAADFLTAQMKAKGLQLMDGRQALQSFQDPRFQQDMIVFVDARDEAHYQKGHIPGAYEFDPYHPENYFATALPVCLQAEQVVVYCNGGDCDDSESAALLLRDAGVAKQKLFVYGGGFSEWETNHLPVETGARNSGILLKPNAAPGAANPSNVNK